MRVGGGGSFLRVGGKRTENYEREGGRSRRLYLRSLRSMAANRLPFPLSFLLAFPPFSSSISKNQHYLLFVSPFAAFHLSPSPNCSIARGREFRSLRFLRLRLSFSLSRLNLLSPFFFSGGSWIVERIHYETSMSLRGKRCDRVTYPFFLGRARNGESVGQ